MQEEQVIQKPDENEVEVELKEEKTEDNVERVEETTETKKPDELEDYSSNVKSRIDKLTRKMREEERQKESAIQFAESVKKENENLKTRLTNLDKGYLEEFNSRVQSQLEAAKRSLKDANESGDADKIVEAQANLAAITVEKSKITKPKVEKTEEQPNQQPIVPNQPQPIPPPRSRS
jgi:DNA polymerase II large subunit